jgi:uncharacterized protein (TIGR02246 family)
MSTPASPPEDEIRALVESWNEALHAKDVSGRTAHYADDVLIFDVVTPLQHAGLDALKKRLTEWFATFTGPVNGEVRDLQITAGQRVAFCHTVQRFRGSLASGATLDMLVRYTTCLRKTGDGWTVTHEHASVPFDPATGLALTGGGQPA